MDEIIIVQLCKECFGAEPKSVERCAVGLANFVIKFGETAEEAVKREVYEETGIKMEVDRLGFINENYFYGDSAANQGKLIYEISFFFYMKVPDGFEPICSSFTEDDHQEFLRWVSPDDEATIYPSFFKTELQYPEYTVKHFVTDERKIIEELR